MVRGKAALRDYWTMALEEVPKLRFTVVDVYVGVETTVIQYHIQKAGCVCEVLVFAGDRVRSGYGTYAA